MYKCTVLEKEREEKIQRERERGALVIKTCYTCACVVCRCACELFASKRSLQSVDTLTVTCLRGFKHVLVSVDHAFPFSVFFFFWVHQIQFIQIVRRIEIRNHIDSRTSQTRERNKNILVFPFLVISSFVRILVLFYRFVPDAPIPMSLQVQKRRHSQRCFVFY